MTSRERVQAAFEHREPDRTPLWEKLIKSPVADEVLGRPCAATNFHYRMEWLADGDWEGLMRQAARDEVDLCKALGFDLIRLYECGTPPDGRPVRIDDNTWDWGTYRQELLPSGWVRSYTPGVSPASAEQRETELRRSLAEPYVEPAPPDDRTFTLLREARRIIAEEDLDLPIFCASYSMGVATLPTTVLMWFLSERDLLAEMYRRNALNGLHRARGLVAEGADIIALGGDLASDHGPMCSPADYRDFIAPGLAMQSRALHEMGIRTTNASDGDLWPILHDFLRTAEVDGYEEIDFAAGMDMKRLRTEYPEKTMIGNVDIRHTLTSGTVEQVREHTIRCIEDGWGGGGHVLMSGNCIHENVPTSLFMAHIEAYRDYFGLN